MVDQENKHMEETAVMDDSSDVEFSCGDSQVDPRVGEEFQAEMPPMISASKRASFLSTPAALDDSFLVGQPVQVMWIDKHPIVQGNGDDDDVDMNQSLKSLRAKRKRSRCSDKIRGLSKKKPRLNLEAVPEIPSSSWEDLEVASFLLGLYTFGKNFTQVKNFMESKGTGDIVLFYYGKFYNSANYHNWSHSRKKRNRKCVSGRKLYTGWRQQQLLSRLIPSISDESQRQMLVNVSKSFAEGKITLEKYVSTAKDLVGLRLLVDAVAIGKGKEDLTVLTAGTMKTTKPWFTVSPKPSSVPSLGVAYTSLTSAEIVNQLKGSSRVSKARCNDIFWEAVWPRLLARGWRSEQPKDRSYFKSKDNIVFIVPGVKEFSRGELVKGDQYFDSVSDILTKVALEPELLEFEAGGGVREAENSSDQSDEESSSPCDVQRHRYLKSPCSNRGIPQMNFIVVDTSLAAGGKLCGLQNLNAESVVSQPKTRIGRKDSSVLESSLESQNVMPLDAKYQVDERFTVIDTSLNHREKLSGFRRWRHLPSDGTRKDDSSIKEEETLQTVKDPSKRLIKNKALQRVNYHSVSGAPSLKRRRLSACIRRDDKKRTVCPEADHLSLCGVQHQNSTSEEMNEDKERYETVLSADYMNLKSDQSKETGSGPSTALVDTQDMSEIKPNGLSSISVVEKKISSEEIRTVRELISSEQEPKGLCSVSDSDKKRATSDPKQAAELPSISGCKSSPSNDLGTTQELGSSEQQEQDQQTNTDAPRRQSTRKRPLTTRALEALESSSFLTTKRVKSTVKPRKRESSTKKNRPSKACNRAKLLPDNGSASLEQRGEDESKLLDQIDDSKLSSLLNGATSEGKVLDIRQDSKPVVLTEHPKLPPIVWKRSFKRSGADSET